MGRLAGIGTGAFELHLDMDKLADSFEQGGLVRPDSPPAILAPPPYLSPLSGLSPAHTGGYEATSPGYTPCGWEPPEQADGEALWSPSSPQYCASPMFYPSSPSYQPFGADAAHAPRIDFDIGFDGDQDSQKTNGLE